MFWMVSYKSMKEQEKPQKTTSQDQAKRYQLFRVLASNSTDKLRELPLLELDLNITEHVEQLQEIDSAVTPLIYASFMGLKDVVKILLTHPHIDIDLQTQNNKQTPLTTACFCANYEIVRLLLIGGAQPNKPNILKQSPLAVILFRLAEQPPSFQFRKVCLMIGSLLIKHGADQNWIIDKKRGLSLLHYFCSLRLKMNKNQKKLNYDIVKFLLENGADVWQMTLEDKGCQQLLEVHCNREQLGALVAEYKAKPREKEGGGRKYTPIGEDFFKIESKSK